MTQGEKYNKVTTSGRRTTTKCQGEMTKPLERKVIDREGKEVDQESFNSMYMMADSGARGFRCPDSSARGMRGLMAKADGSIIETPITANFREG